MTDTQTERQAASRRGGSGQQRPHGPPAYRRGVHQRLHARAELRAGRQPGPQLGERPVPRARPNGAPPPAVAMDGDAGQAVGPAGQDRLLPVGGVPPRSAAGQLDPRLRPRHDRRGGSRAARDLAVHAARAGDRAGARQRRSRPARGVLHRLARDDVGAVRGLRHPVRVRHLPADLRRRLAGRELRPVAAARQPVGVPAPGERRHRPVRRLHRDVEGRGRHGAHPLGRRLGRAGRALQLHGPGVPQRPRQHPAALERQGDPGVQPRGVQRRRLRRGGPQPDLRREDLDGPLPRGLDAAGQGAAAPAAVLLRGLLAARLHRPGAAEGLRPAPAPRPGDLPAQRHPPRHRGPGAHADPPRREGLRLGRCLGDDAEVLRLHVPHAAARGARGVAGRGARAAAAAAPRDHLPDQRRLPRRRARGLPRRRGAAAPDVDHLGGRGEDGLPRHRRRLEGQRRGRAPLAAAARPGAARLLRVLAGQVHERHQRRDPAPVRPAGQQEPLGAHHRGHRPRLGHRPGPALGARAVRRRPGVPRAVPVGEEDLQDQPGQAPARP